MTRRLAAAVIAAISITSVVLCVVGIIVLLGWELNVIESVVFSCAVGLSCDFATHLTHAYVGAARFSPSGLFARLPRAMAQVWRLMDDSTMRARVAIMELGATVTMGFITSFIPGVLLLNAQSYFYYQFGVFLCCIMSFSWIFSFLMCMPALATLGWPDELFIEWWKVTAQPAIDHGIEKMKSKMNGSPNKAKVLPGHPEADES